MHKGQFGAGAILSGGVERLKRELCGMPMMMMMIKLSTPQELSSPGGGSSAVVCSVLFFTQCHAIYVDLVI